MANAIDDGFEIKKDDSVNLRSPSPDVDGVSNSPYTSSNLRTDGQPKFDRCLPSIDDENDPKFGTYEYFEASSTDGKPRSNLF